MDARQRYVDARCRAGEAARGMESLRETRRIAESEAGARLDQLLAQAERSEDSLLREAAQTVRLQRAALHRVGDELARSLAGAIDRLVRADADAVGFAQEADALVLLAIGGRSALADRHRALLRAEAALNDLI